MKKQFLLGIIALAFCTIFSSSSAFADEGLNIKIAPISNYFTVKAGDVQNYTLTVTNNGTEDYSFKLYTAPYVVTDENYSVTFDEENATHYNQITRWVKFKDKNGDFVSEPTFDLKAGEEITVLYRISVPDSIPEGGQYCVIFAENINNSKMETTGVTAVSRVALTLVGHGYGLTNSNVEIVDYHLSHPFSLEGIAAGAKVKNGGNTDFEANYSFTVKSIFGKTLYTNSMNFTVLPETERRFELNWAEAPVFGIFKVNFAVNASDVMRNEEHLVFIVPLFVIIIMLLLLTAIIIWIIILVRKRKERSSRLVV